MSDNIEDKLAGELCVWKKHYQTCKELTPGVKFPDYMPCGTCLGYDITCQKYTPRDGKDGKK